MTVYMGRLEGWMLCLLLPVVSSEPPTQFVFSNLGKKDP